MLPLLLSALLAPPADGPPIALRDVAAEAGVRFRFDRGSRGRHDLPEIMGGGVGLIDADGDGRLDVYLCNGGSIATPPRAGASRLYRNLGGWRFEDVTAKAGCPGPPYAMGAAVGDLDGDGRDDLLVTGWRGLGLYRNVGGTFVDATDGSGLSTKGWSTSAAFADLDGDGDLDLYLCGYVDYDPAAAPHCAAPDGRRDYCGPEEFAAQGGRLYRNIGGFKFEDVSKSSGITDAGGRGLGVLIADVVGDSRPDIYVANDGTPCHLFKNNGDMKFDEIGLAAGVALDGRGEALAGMGVARGDLDGDGRAELLVGNLLGRSTVAFADRGGGLFADATAELGLGATRAVTGFGLALVDLDGDGHLDLLQANGHVLDRERLGVPLAMRPTLLRHDGRRLAPMPGAGPWADRPTLGRGLAVGDLDDDGRPDVVVASLDADAMLLRNESAGGHWLAVDLVGKAPSAVGARLSAAVGGRTIRAEVTAGGSYLAASSRRLFVGLGRADRVDRVEVTWPSGRVEGWDQVDVRRPVRLVEGTGRR